MKIPLSRSSLSRAAVAILLFLIAVSTLPRWWCGRQADRWFDGDREIQQQLARGVERWVRTDLSRNTFTTGSPLINGEWLFATYMMSGLGYGQTAVEHPEWRTRHLELMSRCIDRLLATETHAFETEAWNTDPIESIGSDIDHGSFLGYFNLLLSLHRYLQPDSPYVQWNDRITAHLVRRLEKSPLLLLQSYPNAIWTVDNGAVIGSIGLYDRATGANHRALIEKWVTRCRTRYRDSRTGLLYQTIDPSTGEPTDLPRGSGSALGAYFISFADLDFSRELGQAVHKELERTFLGFGGMREYPSYVRAGRADANSGPILLGIGLTPTGFSLAHSRIHGNRANFTRIYRTTHLFGAPAIRHDQMEFITGGPIGNAILFGMLTALPAERLVKPLSGADPGPALAAIRRHPPENGAQDGRPTKPIPNADKRAAGHKAIQTTDD